MPMALITGAGVRIGKAIAETFAREKYDLILHVNHSLESGQSVAEFCRNCGSTAFLVVADLSTDVGVRTLVTETMKVSSELDVLVNNAGLYRRKGFTDISHTDLREMFQVNVEAPFFLCQGLLPLLEKSQAPVILNITDGALDNPYEKYSHYFMSKAALDMFTKLMALELAPKVRVNGIGPGTVAFPENFTPPEQEAIKQTIPLKRTGCVEDIAKLALYLVREGDFIHGQRINVDGGSSIT